MNIVDTAGTYFGARIGPEARKHVADRPEIKVPVPNATTRGAIAELEAGKGKRFDTIDDLMADLRADD